MRKWTVVLGVPLFALLIGCATKEETSIKIYVQQNLYDKAIVQGQKALLKSPDNGDTHYFIGASYFGKDKQIYDLVPEPAWYADSTAFCLTKAFEHFMKAKKLAPDSWGKSADDNVVSMFGRHFNRGVLASNKGDFDKAALEYSLATIADPENYDGYYAHAAAMLELANVAKKKGDDDEFMRVSEVVIQDLDRVLALEPEDRQKLVSAHHTKGEVLFSRGDLEGAQKSYAEAITLDPENYELMITMADRFYNEGDWENAVRYLQDAMSLQERLNLIDADDADPYAALAGALTKLGRRDEALATYEKVIKLTPNDRTTLYNMMVTHYKAGEAADKEGRSEEARNSFNQAITIGKELIRMDAKVPEYYQVVGAAYRGIGDTQQAARHLKKYQELRKR